MIHQCLIDCPIPEKIDRGEICDLVKETNVFRVFKHRLYLWQQDYNFWKCLEKIEEKVEVRQLFSSEWQPILRDSLLSDLVNWLKDNPELQLNFDEHYQADCIHFLNGVLELKTGKLKEAQKENYLTNMIKANYLLDENSLNTELWDKFCSDIFTPELLNEKKQLLLQIIGYTISNLYDAKKAFFLIGPSCSGKSVVLRFLQEVLGEENISNIPIEKFKEKFSIGGLFGKMANLSGEIPIDIINSKCCDIFKQLVGGDNIEIERKGQMPFYYRSRATLIFAGNTMPKFSNSDGSESLMERMQLLVFNNTIPSEQRDPMFDTKLLEEKDSILTCAANELIKIFNGKYHFTSGSEEKKYMEAYKQETNTVTSFVNKECTLTEDALCYISDLYEQYLSFTESEALPAEKRSNFRSQILMIHGITLAGKRRLNNRAPKACFQGIRYNNT